MEVILVYVNNFNPKVLNIDVSPLGSSPGKWVTIPAIAIQHRVQLIGENEFDIFKKRLSSFLNDKSVEITRPKN